MSRLMALHVAAILIGAAAWLVLEWLAWRWMDCESDALGAAHRRALDDFPEWGTSG